MALGPLTVSDIGALVADALRTDAVSALPLAVIIHQKTQGNAFHVRQFLGELHADGLLSFEPRTGSWHWDIATITESRATDDVDTALAGRLARYTSEAREACIQLACLGTRANVATLAKVLQTSEGAVHRILAEPTTDDLLHRIGSEYAFAHDRVRETAYAQLTDEERSLRHLRTARALAADASGKDLEENVFEILSHYRRGMPEVHALDEKLYVAELNLVAGKRSRAAAAYEAAADYFTDGCALLDPVSRDRNRELAFGLEFQQADCRFILGDVQFAEERLAALTPHCRGPTERALVVGRQMIILVHQGNAEAALTLVLGCLRDLGESLPLSPTDGDVQQSYQELATTIAGRPIESLVNLPLMTDDTDRAVTDLLEALCGPAGAIRLHLLTLIQLRIARLSLEKGLSDAAAHAFAGLTRIVGWSFGELETGRTFGALALGLVEQRGLDRYAERVYSVVAAFVWPYTVRLRQASELALRAAESGPERGGLSFTGYSWGLVISLLFDGGAPLLEVQKRAEVALKNASVRKFTMAIQMIAVPLMVVRALRGLTPGLDSLMVTDADTALVTTLTTDPRYQHNVPRFMVRQLQLRYYARNYTGCLEAIREVESGLFFPLYEKVGEFLFFAALTYAAVLSEFQLPREEFWRELQSAQRELSRWAERCPVNFAERAALVSAEVARLQGDIGRASELYEEAIRLAQENGFLQVEALANELAARLYETRGLRAIRDAYLGNARARYLQWGADGKVRDLDQMYPHLVERVTARGRADSESRTQIATGEFGAVMEMHRAVSGELVFNRLIERLMVTVVEHAGAVRGLILLPHDGAMQVVAEAVTIRDTVAVHMRHQAEPQGELPQSILNYVVRTQDYVIVDDALAARVHSTDEYVRRVRPRAILCLPLVKQKRLVGVLYLENTLSSHVFTAERLSVLQLLASQAAISIENAALFRDVERARESERRIGDELRRSFDMIPALAWRASQDGSFEFANRQWHEYTGITPENARMGTWVRAFDGGDDEKVETAWRRALEGGSAAEVEARMRRFDGEVRTYLVRVTPMRNAKGEVIAWHGTHTDIEGIKRAEQAQEALARASRLTAMGELTVSITHEVSQPIMAIQLNAVTCLRWLDPDQLDVAKAREAANRIIRDGQRAREVIASMRTLAKKGALETTEVSINEVIEEVIVLARSEIERNHIGVVLELALNVGATTGVRVQVQQVILNLVINAIEAMANVSPESRQLRIGSRREQDGQVRVDVSDSGSGLDPVNRDKVFEPFFTTKSEGLGLGLSICRSIIESHGGRLWASPNVPCGCVFSFVLPDAGAMTVH